MANDKLRRQIACEAARLLYAGQESDGFAGVAAPVNGVEDLIAGEAT